MAAEFGYSQREVLEALRRGERSTATATYFLVRQRELRKGSIKHSNPHSHTHPHPNPNPNPHPHPHRSPLTTHHSPFTLTLTLSLTLSLTLTPTRCHQELPCHAAATPTAKTSHGKEGARPTLLPNPTPTPEPTPNHNT